MMKIATSPPAFRSCLCPYRNEFLTSKFKATGGRFDFPYKKIIVLS